HVVAAKGRSNLKRRHRYWRTEYVVLRARDERHERAGGQRGTRRIPQYAAAHHDLHRGRRRDSERRKQAKYSAQTFHPEYESIERRVDPIASGPVEGGARPN